MKDTEVAELVENLNQKIASELPLLEAAAENIQTLQGHEGEPLRWYAEATFLVLQMDFDMMVTIRAMLADPSNRLTMEKTLALNLSEVESAVGNVLQGLGRAVRSPGSVTADQFSIPALDAAAREFKDSMRPMRDDKDFMSALTTVRDTAAAHLWGRKDGRLNGSAQWVLSRRTALQGIDGVMRSQFVAYSISTLVALHALQADLSAAWGAEGGA